jgi:RNA polymerase primary sigma factor
MEELINGAEKRGYVTFDELNQALPSDLTSPEQIEDIMAMLKDMGIDVVEASEVLEPGS